MKKTGFTLAEVLITLAIVGLIAALTLPGLNSNVNNRRIGPALAKAINNLENANRMILVENEIGTIDETNDYINLLAERLNGSLDEDNAIIRGKDGITYTIGDSDDDGNQGESNKYTGTYFPVGIDINGDKQPNRSNSDRFLVYVDTRGAVIPAGGAEADNYLSSGVVECEAGATVAASGGEVDSSDYGTCTAAIINAGWEVNYIPSASGDGDEYEDINPTDTPATPQTPNVDAGNISQIGTTQAGTATR